MKLIRKTVVFFLLVSPSFGEIGLVLTKHIIKDNSYI